MSCERRDDQTLRHTQAPLCLYEAYVLAAALSLTETTWPKFGMVAYRYLSHRTETMLNDAW